MIHRNSKSSLPLRHQNASATTPPPPPPTLAALPQGNHLQRTNNVFMRTTLSNCALRPLRSTSAPHNSAVKLIRKHGKEFSRGGGYFGGGGRYFTVDTYPTTCIPGFVIKNAFTGIPFHPIRRVGNAADEALLLKVSICTGEGAAAAGGPIVLYYGDAEEHEAHFQTNVHADVKRRFNDRCHKELYRLQKIRDAEAATAAREAAQALLL